MILTYVATAFIVLAFYFISLLVTMPKGLSELNEGFLWMAFAVLLTLILVRPAYSLWLSMDFWIGPWAPDESGKLPSR
jgi:hypothetical protein